MEIENLFKLAKEYFKVALLGGMLMGAFSFLALVTTQKNFCSSADILISQDQPNANYYALSQSANYLTHILSQSIYSEKFLEEVEATGKIPSNFLKGDSAQKIKAWRKIIRVKNNSDVGIMNIKIFADTPIQANKISQAVLEVLVKKNSFFLGQNKNINVRVLSGPIVEKNPSFFQIMSASVGGFVMGFILVCLWALYREELVKNSERISFNKGDYLSADSDYWKQRLGND